MNIKEIKKEFTKIQNKFFSDSKQPIFNYNHIYNFAEVTKIEVVDSFMPDMEDEENWIVVKVTGITKEREKLIKRYIKFSKYCKYIFRSYHISHSFVRPITLIKRVWNIETKNKEVKNSKDLTLKDILTEAFIRLPELKEIFTKQNYLKSQQEVLVKYDIFETEYIKPLNLKIIYLGKEYGAIYENYLIYKFTTEKEKAYIRLLNKNEDIDFYFVSPCLIAKQAWLDIEENLFIISEPCLL